VRWADREVPGGWRRRQKGTCRSKTLFLTVRDSLLAVQFPFDSPTAAVADPRPKHPLLLLHVSAFERVLGGSSP
jgi:hypothetical protein